MASEPVTKPRPPRTLLEQLGPRLACIRANAHGMAGDRPYRLFAVVRRWSGGGPGRGQLEDASRVELRCGRTCAGAVVPPKVLLSGQWSRAMHGLVEEGQAVVEELDPTYTEAELDLFGRLEEGDEAFFELVQDDRDGQGPDRPARRLTPEGPPFRDAGRAQWVWRLRSQEPQAAFGRAQLGPDGGMP